MSFTFKTETLFLQATTSVDLNEFVLGAGLESSVYPGEAQRVTLRLTLDNHDGRFTPGGTGEYSDFDWFRQTVAFNVDFLDSNGSTIEGAQVFHGLVNDFAITEDSIFESTVELSCVDFFTVAGRGAVAAPPQVALETTGFGMFRDIMNGVIFDGDLVFAGAQTPECFNEAPVQLETIVRTEQVNWDTDNFNVAFPRDQLLSFESIDDGRVADPVTQTILPTGPSSFGYLNFTQNVLVTRAARPADGKLAGRSGVHFFTGCFTPKEDSIVKNTVLSTERPQPAGTMPLLKLQRGFNVRNLVNDCQMTMKVQDNPDVQVEATNDTSVAQSGVRNISFNRMADPFGKAFGTTEEREQILTRKAEFWTKRFSTNRYDINQITVSALSFLDAAQTSAEAQQFAGLLARAFHPVIVDNQPYASVGTKVTVTPTDIKCTVDLVSGYDMQSLVVGKPVLGVLGKMRIG
jgi:hypothetical protein